MASKGQAFKMAQRVCLGQPKQVSNKALSRYAKKLDEEDVWMDQDGELHLRRTVNNLPDECILFAPFYKEYRDWKKRGEYFSDAQFQSPMQLVLHRLAEKESGSEFFDIGNQENIDFSEMPLYPIDVEKDILDDFTLLLIGRRRSGKTWASRFLMYNMKERFPFVVVITGTKLNNFWSSYVPVEFIYDIEEINTVIDVLFARQTYLIANPQLGVDPRVCLILDDVMGNKYAIRFSEQLDTVFTNGRHFKMFILITLQDPKGVGPALRENTDCAVIFRVYEGGRKEVIYKEWLSYFHNNERLHREMVADFFWNNTGFIESETGELFQEDRGTEECDLEGVVPQAVIVLQGRTTNDLQKVFKKMVAEDPGDFYLGCKAYYKAALDGEYDRIFGTSPVFRKGREEKSHGPANPDAKDLGMSTFPNARTGGGGSQEKYGNNAIEGEHQARRKRAVTKLKGRGPGDGEDKEAVREERRSRNKVTKKENVVDLTGTGKGKRKAKEKAKAPARTGKRTRPAPTTTTTTTVPR